MSQGVPSVDPLRAFLSGKRRHERHSVTLAVELGGLRLQFAGRCVDISEGGALLAIPQHLVREVRRRDEDVFGVIARELGDGFDVRFLNEGVVVEAFAVRLCIPPGDEDTLYLGCRFAETLSIALQERLGLSGSGDD